MASSKHRWTIDVMEEDSAAIEVDGRQIVHVPRWILPQRAREGVILAVTHERTGAASRLSIEIDDDAMKDASAESDALVLRSRAKRDEGGDIEL